MTNYSVSVFSSYRQLFLTALPEENVLYQGDEQGHGQTVPDYPRQIKNVLEQCRNILEKEDFSDAEVISNFFLADISKKELVRQLMEEISIDGGAATFIPQAPANGSVIAAEIWAIAPKTAETTAKNGLRFFFTGDIRPDEPPVGAYSRSLSAFQKMGMRLKQAGFTVEQILRTWIYQGHLVLPEGKTQRYKELNRARTDFFDGTKFLTEHLPAHHRGTVYPASTGIGADDTDVVLAAVAMATDRKDVIVVPLENPHQTSAFDYGAAYSPQSPKFSRAMAVAADGSCMIFVSGTASITDSESRHPEDPAAQTETTLDNIAALIDRNNLERHGIPLSPSSEDSPLASLQCARVYVKRPAELETIQTVCEKRLRGIPVLYTISDVCRPELLVEIEGIAVVGG